MRRMHRNRGLTGLRDAVEGSVEHRMHSGKAQSKAHPPIEKLPRRFPGSIVLAVQRNVLNPLLRACTWPHYRHCSAIGGPLRTRRGAAPAVGRPPDDETADLPTTLLLTLP